jgi:uncharacterized protein (TIGR03382 family)
MRARLFAIAVLGILDGCVDPSTSTSTQGVIGGTLTPPGQYPATGALVAQSQGQRVVFCTGTLIAPDAVLTAAHCLLPPPQAQPFMPSFTLALDANTAPASELTPAREWHYNPQYDPNANPPGTLGHTYDVGVVLLAHPVAGAMPAYLPTSADLATLVQGMPLEITGYGLTVASNDNTAGVKYSATTTLASIGPYEIGVGTAGSAQNCHGDSGGPAYIHIGSGLRMLGVVSRGNTGGEDTCDRGGIDSRADAYRSWISTYTTLADPPPDPTMPPDGGVPPGPTPPDPAQPETAAGCSATDPTGGGLWACGVLALLAGLARRRR